MHARRKGVAGVFTRFASVRGKQGVPARKLLELLHLLVRQAVVILLDFLRERVWAGPRRLRRARGSIRRSRSFRRRGVSILGLTTTRTVASMTLACCKRLCSTISMVLHTSTPPRRLRRGVVYADAKRIARLASSDSNCGVKVAQLPRKTRGELEAGARASRGSQARNTKYRT